MSNILADLTDSISKYRRITNASPANTFITSLDSHRVYAHRRDIGLYKTTQTLMPDYEPGKITHKQINTQHVILNSVNIMNTPLQRDFAAITMILKDCGINNSIIAGGIVERWLALYDVYKTCVSILDNSVGIESNTMVKLSDEIVNDLESNLCIFDFDKILFGEHASVILDQNHKIKQQSIINSDGHHKTIEKLKSAFGTRLDFIKNLSEFLISVYDIASIDAYINSLLEVLTVSVDEHKQLRKFETLTFIDLDNNILINKDFATFVNTTYTMLMTELSLYLRKYATGSRKNVQSIFSMIDALCKISSKMNYYQLRSEGVGASYDIDIYTPQYSNRKSYVNLIVDRLNHINDEITCTPVEYEHYGFRRKNSNLNTPKDDDTTSNRYGIVSHYVNIRIDGPKFMSVLSLAFNHSDVNNKVELFQTFDNLQSQVAMTDSTLYYVEHVVDDTPQQELTKTASVVTPLILYTPSAEFELVRRIFKRNYGEDVIPNDITTDEEFVSNELDTDEKIAREYIRRARLLRLDKYMSKGYMFYGPVLGTYIGRDSPFSTLSFSRSLMVNSRMTDLDELLMAKLYTTIFDSSEYNTAIHSVNPNSDGAELRLAIRHISEYHLLRRDFESESQLGTRSMKEISVYIHVLHNITFQCLSDLLEMSINLPQNEIIEELQRLETKFGVNFSKPDLS